MTAKEPPKTVYCVIFGKNETLHLRDEIRSKQGAYWAACSNSALGDSRAVPLAVARTRYASYVPCNECFPGRVLPAEED